MVVVGINKTGSGYGKNVVIDQGYGWTKHCMPIEHYQIKKGAGRKKARKIGAVGLWALLEDTYIMK